MEEKPNRFNLRVYFLLLDQQRDRILVADEIIRKKWYTKFPGGGLEFGEGTADCVLREAIEELGQEVEIISHFYTTDFFLRSAFKNTDQVVSIYYIVRLKSEQRFQTTERKFDFSQSENDEESFRWVKLSELDTADFHFAADKKVVELILSDKTMPRHSAASSQNSPPVERPGKD